MTLTIVCPNCQMPLAIPKEFEGKTGTCRACGKPVTAIAPTAPPALEKSATKESKFGGSSLWWFKKHDELVADWIPVDPNSAPVKYRSNQRVAAIRVFSQAGWIIGNIQAPHGTRLVDFLNQQRDFLPMIDVFLEGRPKPLDGFALQKHAVYFLAAMDSEELRSATELGNFRDQPVSCLLPIGSVYATARIPKEVSVAQHFARHCGFVILTECHYRVRDPWRGQILDDTEPVLLLNTQATIGVSDRAAGET